MKIDFCHPGDCRQSMRQMLADGGAGKVQTIITSPPYYGLRDYGVDGQLGLEATPEEYVAKMVEVFREARRVLRDDGTLWLNIGDSYAANRSYQVPSTKGGTKHSYSQAVGGKGSVIPDGLKAKDLIGIPWRLAFALQADGWYLRQDIIWHKPNPMPESVRDRCTKAHEYIFLLSKSERYFFDSEAIKEPAVSEKPAGNKRHKYADAYNAGTSEEHRTKAGLLALTGVEWETRNRRSVWTIPTESYSEAHFATFPQALVEPCVLAGSRPGDIVFDPFLGSGTVAQVAQRLGRHWLGCELNPEYIELQHDRTRQKGLQLGAAA